MSVTVPVKLWESGPALVEFVFSGVFGVPLLLGTMVLRLNYRQAHTASCPNMNRKVFTMPLVVANSPLHASSFRTPNLGYTNSRGTIQLRVYRLDTTCQPVGRRLITLISGQRACVLGDVRCFTGPRSLGVPRKRGSRCKVHLLTNQRPKAGMLRAAQEACTLHRGGLRRNRPQEGSSIVEFVSSDVFRMSLLLETMVLGLNNLRANTASCPTMDQNVFRDLTWQAAYVSEMFVASPDLDHCAWLGRAGANARSIF